MKWIIILLLISTFLLAQDVTAIDVAFINENSGYERIKVNNFFETLDINFKNKIINAAIDVSFNGQNIKEIHIGFDGTIINRTINITSNKKITAYKSWNNRTLVVIYKNATRNDRLKINLSYKSSELLTDEPNMYLISQNIRFDDVESGHFNEVHVQINTPDDMDLIDYEPKHISERVKRGISFKLGNDDIFFGTVE